MSLSSGLCMSTNVHGKEGKHPILEGELCLVINISQRRWPCLNLFLTTFILYFCFDWFFFFCIFFLSICCKSQIHSCWTDTKSYYCRIVNGFGNYKSLNWWERLTKSVQLKGSCWRIQSYHFHLDSCSMLALPFLIPAIYAVEDHHLLPGTWLTCFWEDHRSTGSIFFNYSSFTSSLELQPLK